MKRIRLLGLLLAVIAIVIAATPVYADTADPDSTPTVSNIYVYRNLLETGDRLYLWYANIPYATTPDTDVTETFVWRLIDTDGVTVLGSTTGYAYNDDGYGYNVYSMYFDAAAALTWEALYTLRLTGNPSVFVTPKSYNFPISANKYTDETTTAANQAALASTIITLAGDLDAKWALTADFSLLLQTETGVVLSIYGEAVFRGVIFGVQALAPAAFRFVIEDIAITDRTWSSNYTDTLTNQWSGTWVETAQQGAEALFGSGWNLGSLLLVLAIMGAVIYANISLTSDAWNGMIDGAFVLIIGARLGMIGLGYIALLAAVCVIFMGIRIWNTIPR